MEPVRTDYAIRLCFWLFSKDSPYVKIFTMKTNKLTIGILAHVDAGKTTLSEGILYHSGSIRRLGRVDHGDAFLDTEELERTRGITIFSKQARFLLGEREVTLLDTPGHVDFAAEMERTLPVLDYAVLVVNGADGVQSHTMTLWKLLERYGLPVFLFVNKMDQVGTDREQLMRELQRRLDERCVDFGEAEGSVLSENLAVCDEALMEEYFSRGSVSVSSIATAVADRKLFPCYFGSALKSQGIEEFLQGMERYTVSLEYPEEFGARVYKITRDKQGNRLTHMKITGGSLKVKAEIGQEKVDQIRIYSGGQFKAVNEAEAGTVCAVTGLNNTRAGQGLGAVSSAEKPFLEPVLSYQIELPPSCDVHGTLLKLRQLEEESPQLQIVWNEQLNELHAQIMGEIEIEILKKLIRDRFDIEVEFGTGSIVYKETLEGPVIGVGHFEPLGHYAEVHLLMEPGTPGSGLVLESRCSEDVLDRNWQRLILSHLAERKHRGVLTGAEITDMRITLIAGKAHKKHTGGGDFRQATYRAVRQGLKKARCVLLEPVYEFQLEVPAELVGRALTDLQKMGGTFGPPDTDGCTASIRGTAPVAVMREYHSEVASYTKGCGRLFCIPKGYAPCHNSEDVIEAAGYDSEKDSENPTGSVFCSHGAGFSVGWEDAEKYMHVESGWRLGESEELRQVSEAGPAGGNSRTEASGTAVSEKELEEIFARTYGKIKRERYPIRRTVRPEMKTGAAAGSDTEAPAFSPRKTAPAEIREQYLLVDGYNIIFAWEELAALAATSLEGARNQLLDILCNYQGYQKNVVIVVFDAYKVEGGRGSVSEYNNIHVIYTKEAETADQYIERAVHKIGKKYDVTVATSDGQIQMIIWGRGAGRLSAQGLWEEVQTVNEKIRRSHFLQNRHEGGNYPFRKALASVRRRNQDFEEDV